MGRNLRPRLRWISIFCERFMDCYCVQQPPTVSPLIISVVFPDWRQHWSWWMSKHCPPTIDFFLNLCVQCQNTLTISIYINPVKHAVGEILSSHFLIFIPIDCTDGLWEHNKISMLKPGLARKIQCCRCMMYCTFMMLRSSCRSMQPLPSTS